MISSVLFDLGGTLIEEPSGNFNTEQNYYEIQVKAIHHSLMKDGISVEWPLFKDQYEKIRIRQKTISKRTLREYDMRKRVSNTLRFFKYDVPFISDTIRRAVDAYMVPYVNSLRINKSAYDVLKKLTAEYKLGVVTNFAYYPGAYQILDRFNLRPFFKAIIVSGEVGWKKPSRRIFEIALSKLSVKPGEAVFVGDDYEADIIGAKESGMKTIFLCKESADSKRADIIVKSITELPSAVNHL